mmetsp:Transcript_69377/g.178812  ORF Transcript_69377/g.178812 Transcript_69377/m.178812 type:complete len:263 (-) Transcript_69377:829-1617(-)
MRGVHGLVHALDDCGACTCQREHPLGHLANAQLAAKRVAEVAAVARQKIVVAAKPRLSQALDDSAHLILRELGPAHGDRLAVHVLGVAPRRTVVHTSPVLHRIAEAPLLAIDLHGSMEGPRAQWAGEVVNLLHCGAGNIVDVQPHVLALGRPPGMFLHLAHHQRRRPAGTRPRRGRRHRGLQQFVDLGVHVARHRLGRDHRRGGGSHGPEQQAGVLPTRCLPHALHLPVALARRPNAGHGGRHRGYNSRPQNAADPASRRRL